MYDILHYTVVLVDMPYFNTLNPTGSMSGSSIHPAPFPSEFKSKCLLAPTLDSRGCAQLKLQS